ncbi:MAG: hypothetical protein DCE90_14885 [Pseudanabaena sp.]|nr:MAG: hypothetical protein DCE90_14885 [Pseudanabaena sp.]
MSAIANSNQPEDKAKTSRVPSNRRNLWTNIPWKKLSSLLIAIALCFYLTACGSKDKAVTVAPTKPVSISAGIAEVAPPQEIQRLSRMLERYEPQISIISPKPEQVLTDTQVSVKFDVKNLPIFKNAEFGLGPHIHIALDNQEYKALYDLNQTVNFDNLSAGTHTIRAFASRPWHESFKNKGAYAQATFHVLTKTGENTPEPQVPLLTYSRPVGTYGAEPIMLDFYLQNAPQHLLGSDDEVLNDWQIRATVDGQSFTFDRWEPIYLTGFKTGQNWVKLELLEPDGDAIANVFNSTAHLINYQPSGNDTLARLVRGEKIANIEAIVDPDYVPPAPVATPEPEAIATPEAVETPEPVAAPVAEEVKPAEQTTVQEKVEATPEPIKPATPAKVTAPPKEAPQVTESKPSPAPEKAIAKPEESVAEPVAASPTRKNYLKDYFAKRAKDLESAKAANTSDEPVVTDLKATSSTTVKVLPTK